MKKTSLTIEEIDRLIEICDEHIPDKEKAKKFNEIIYYKDLNEIIFYRKRNNLTIGNKLKRIQNISEYFYKNGLYNEFKETYKCDLEELNIRLDNLNIIYDAFTLNIPIVDKLQVLFKIFDSVDEFKSKYSLMLKFGQDDKRLDSARNALDNFDYIINIINSCTDIDIKNAKNRVEIEKILEENDYLENYLYAEYVVSTYINVYGSYLKNKFLKNMNINKKIFEYCVEVVKFLNPILYQEYLDCIDEKNKQRYFALDHTIRSLAHGIQTGNLPDGTPFDILEFYKRVPFKEAEEKFVPTLKDFICNSMENSDNIYHVINEYLSQNKITKIVYVTEEYLASRNLIVKGVKITPDIVNKVFTYIKINKLPKIMAVFRIVLDKYLNNEIDLNSLTTPEEVTNNNSIYNNPYTLTLKNRKL